MSMDTSHPKPMLNLQPKAIWQQFQMLCDTPRPSFHEDMLRQKLFDWALELGLTPYIDTCGNLLIKKNASIGMEHKATIVLQGHLDIVAQKTADSSHDFVKDPITTYIDNGWVSADKTTLGADNGIGVAAALAVLASDDIEHGPIEALFTIEEETSLRGASELEENILKGKILLNLDSEDRGDVYIGCAGGVDINGRKQYALTPAIKTNKSLQIDISGLKGGHSGLDIHKGRASAILLLATLLNQLNKHSTIAISSLNGGTLRNAIARDAQVTISFPEEHQASVEQIIQQQSAIFKTEFKSTDPHIEITTTSNVAIDSVLNSTDQNQLIDLLNALPHGVESMSPTLPDITHTSNNLGVVSLVNGLFQTCLLARSLEDDCTQLLADKVTKCLATAQMEYSLDNAYPGWLPDPETGLLKKFLDIHQEEMGFAAKVKVIHAGLECGIIGAKYPGMEMVSFGPNIRGAHSPDERLEIDSVADFWQLLVQLLRRL